VKVLCSFAQGKGIFDPEGVEFFSLVFASGESYLSLWSLAPTFSSFAIALSIFVGVTAPWLGVCQCPVVWATSSENDQTHYLLKTVFSPLSRRLPLRPLFTRQSVRVSASALLSFSFLSIWDDSPGERGLRAFLSKWKRLGESKSLCQVCWRCKWSLDSSCSWWLSKGIELRPTPTLLVG